MPLTSRQKEDLKQGDHFSFFNFQNKFLLEKGLISLHNNNFSSRCVFFRRYKTLKISFSGDLALQGAVAQYLKENGFTDAREKFIEEANVTNVSLNLQRGNLSVYDKLI